MTLSNQPSSFSDPASAPPGRGHTTSDVSKRYRVGEDTVRLWIKTGKLKAINTRDARCGRPRYVVTPEALAEFERSREAATPTAPKPKRQKKTTGTDYYPD